MRTALLRRSGLAALAILLLGAKPPSRARFAGGVFFPEELASKIAAGKFDPFEVHTGALSVRFEADGKMLLELGQERSSCRYKPTPPDQLILECEGAKEARTVRWTWLGADRARTNLFSEERVLGRAPHDLEESIKDYDRKFEERARPELSGDWKSVQGERLHIPPRGSVTLGGEKRWMAIVDCLDLSDPVKTARTRCVILSVPGRRPIKWPAPDDSGMMLLTQRAQGLEESVFPGLNPAGLAYEPRAGGRLFTRTSSTPRE